MIPDPSASDKKKSNLSRAVVYLVLWLIFFAGLLEMSSGLLDNGLVDLFDAERMSDSERTRLIVYLVSSIVFLALGLNSLFSYFRTGQGDSKNDSAEV